jgi:TPR repeat protein
VPAAQYDLATLYLTGHGVPNDAYEASLWFKRAAALGMAQAQYEYAVMLLRGQGLNADRPRAMEYLASAAGKGQPGAQNRLAHAYFEGVGVGKSLREAAKWRLIAAAQGVADEKLDAMIKRLPEADLRAAEQLASAWLDKAAVGGAPL